MLPITAVKQNPNLLLATTQRGGHVAWSHRDTSKFQSTPYMVHIAVAYLEAYCEMEEIRVPVQNISNDSENSRMAT